MRRSMDLFGSFATQIPLNFQTLIKFVLNFHSSLKMVATKNANARQKFFCPLLNAGGFHWWRRINRLKSISSMRNIQFQQFLPQSQAHHIGFAKLVIFSNAQCFFACIHFWSKNHCLLHSNELHNFIRNGWRSQWDRFYLWHFYVRYGFSTKRRSLKWTEYLDTDELNAIAASISLSCSLFVVEIHLICDFFFIARYL